MHMQDTIVCVFLKKNSELDKARRWRIWILGGGGGGEALRIGIRPLGNFWLHRVREKKEIMGIVKDMEIASQMSCLRLSNGL